MCGLSPRAALGERQRAVLDALLSGRNPPGFDPRGTALTTRVLHHKRMSAALNVAPELALLPSWRERFHAWATTHPQQGCAHDDVRAFAITLGAEPWVRLHEVYDGRRRAWCGRLGGRWTVIVGAGSAVWRLGGQSLPRGV